MTTIAKKAFICLLFLSLIAWAYTHIGAVTLARSYTLSLLLPIDEVIPLISAMSFFYASVYFFWIPPILLSGFTVREFFRLVTVTGVAVTLALVIHYHLPSAYPRPILPTDDVSLAMEVLKFYHWFDLPNNTFPSTHCVVVTTLLATMRSRLTPVCCFMYEVWGGLILASTLLVKQHYVVDVCGGIILGTVVYALMTPSTRATTPPQVHSS